MHVVKRSMIHEDLHLRGKLLLLVSIWSAKNADLKILSAKSLLQLCCIFGMSDNQSFADALASDSLPIGVTQYSCSY